MVESKIAGITILTTKSVLNAKVKGIENKIPDITGFITTNQFSGLTEINVNERSAILIVDDTLMMKNKKLLSNSAVF